MKVHTINTMKENRKQFVTSRESWKPSQDDPISSSKEKNSCEKEDWMIRWNVHILEKILGNKKMFRPDFLKIKWTTSYSNIMIIFDVLRISDPIPPLLMKFWGRDEEFLVCQGCSWLSM